MIKPPYTKWINDIKTKLGFNRTMTASGEDVVDAVNKQAEQIASLTPIYTYNTANEVPTANEILTSLSDKPESSTFIIQYWTNNMARLSMIYNQTNNRYGAGLMFGYYGSKWYKVVNTNSSISMTAL